MDICGNDTQLWKVTLVFLLKMANLGTTDAFICVTTHTLIVQSQQGRRPHHDLCSGTRPFLSTAAFFSAFIRRHETPNVPSETAKTQMLATVLFFPPPPWIVLELRRSNS